METSMKRRNRILSKQAPAGVLRRRDLLLLAGSSIMGLGAVQTLGLSSPARAAVGGPLALFTWQGYDLTDSFKQWRADHGIEQTQKYINNQFDVVSILKGPGGKEFDSSSANQAYTHLFQQLGLTSPITAAEVPSLAKMYPFFQDSPIWKSTDGSYNSVPW